MTDTKLRTGRFRALERILTSVQALHEDTVTENEVRSYLESTQNNWEKLEEAHEAIVDITDEKDVHVQFKAYEPMCTTYHQIRTILYKHQRTLKAAVPSVPKLNMKLPDMALPNFDGKYEDWPTFQDLFTASIHSNSALSGSQKLQYLKSCLRGEAASIIKSFTITNANYSEAWSLLESQYDNKREIITSHIKRLLFQPSIKHESAAALQEMLTLTLESLRSLKVLGRPTDQWDDLVCVLLSEKFDVDTRAEWARSLKGTNPPTFKEVQDFLQQHIRTLHAKCSSNQAVSRVSVAHNGAPKKLNTYHTSVQSSCQHCKGDHQLFQCTELKDMSPDKRHSIVKSLKLCLNCLREGHSYKECRSSSKCRRCNKPHNTFLHFDDSSPPTQTSSNQQQSSSSQHISNNQQLNIHTSTMASDSPRLLKTALVDVFDASNIKYQLRVFIDEGGQGSLIKEKTMNRLGLQKQRTDFLISGVCGAQASRSNWRTNIRLFSRINNQHIDVDLFAVPKITNTINLFQNHKPHTSWSHLKDLQLADPRYYEGGEIDILLGADSATYILNPSIKRAGRDAPVAQDTIFGWVLTGNIMDLEPQRSYQAAFQVNGFKCLNTETIRNCSKIQLEPQQHSSTHQESTYQILKESVSVDLQPARYNFQQDNDKISVQMCVSGLSTTDTTVSADLTVPKCFGGFDLDNIVHADLPVPKCFGGFDLHNIAHADLQPVCNNLQHHDADKQLPPKCASEFPISVTPVPTDFHPARYKNVNKHTINIISTTLCLIFRNILLGLIHILLCMVPLHRHTQHYNRFNFSHGRLSLPNFSVQSDFNISSLIDTAYAMVGSVQNVISFYLYILCHDFHAFFFYQISLLAFVFLSYNAYVGTYPYLDVPFFITKFNLHYLYTKNL